MKRLLLDTCVIIDLLSCPGDIDKAVLGLLSDSEYELCASFETMREIVVHFNNKKLLSTHWKSAEDVLRTIEDDLIINILPLRPEVGYTYARLQLNVAQEHKDPSDHIIISHAISQRIPLLSSDTRFPYYRKQGLELIEY